MSYAFINEQCSLIRKCGENLTVEQLKDSLDKFVVDLNDEHGKIRRDRQIEKILSVLLSLRDRQRVLTESNLMDHEFFVILRDDFAVDQFRRRHDEKNVPNKILVNISILFLNMSHKITSTNVKQIKTLLFSSSLINEIARCLNEMATTGEHLSDFSLLRSTIHFLSAFKTYLRTQTITDEYQLVSPIFSSTIDCLSSERIVEMLKNLENNFQQRLNESQMLFLDSLPFYLQWYSDYQKAENFRRPIRNLLGVFVQWLTICDAQSFLNSSPQICYTIRHLSFFLIRPVEFENINVFADEFEADYCRLASFWSEVLSSIVDLPAKDFFAKPSLRTAIQNLYNLTLHSKVLKFIKTRSNLIPNLLKLTEIDQDEIQIHSYRCLGKLLTEDDIKRLANAEKIAAVFIEFLSNTIDDPKKRERFHSLLESLKNFVQHDQVKSELVKQDALPLLLRCVTQFEFDPVKVQQNALEILLGLSFDDETSTKLKQNENFVKYLRNLAGETSLKRAAERLLWKLEKEEVAVAQPNLRNSFQFDLMISYSHRDEQICFQIHDQLVADGFRVWIDRDCLRGSTMVGIANAIENSQHVLICMSNTYKQSVYCQSEAHYAFERNCKLIPILIEQNYKPDGWLGMIVSGKIYVDFSKNDLKSAYVKLKSEILQENSVRESTPTLNDDENPRLPIQHSESILDLPENLNEWTEKHVRSFFIQQGLAQSFLLLCPQIDGFRLQHLYEMCLSNRESMYQSLKHELNEKHHQLLPINDYLTFLQATKTYAPTPNSTVTICNLI